MFILRLSTPCILTVSFFFLSHLNAHLMLNTYIYHLLPPTCFDVCYTIFRDTVVLFAQELYVAPDTLIKKKAIGCTLHF